MSVAVHLILQLGYFKAKRQFFAYERRETVEDIGYILNQHFAGTDLGAIKTPSRPIQVQFRQTSLNLFDYRHCDGKTKVELEQKVLRHANSATGSDNSANAGQIGPPAALFSRCDSRA